MLFKLVMNILLGLGIITSPTSSYKIKTPEPDLSKYSSCVGKSWTNNSLTDGFIDQWDWCIPGYVSTESWFIKQPELVYGTAVFYSPGIMKATAKHRGMEYPDGYLGGVALGSPGEIGETVWLYGPNGWEGPYLVVDCPQRVDVFTTIVIRQQVVEVDFNTAVRWGMVKWNNPYIPNEGWYVEDWVIDDVLVFKGTMLPIDIFEREPVYFADWWLERVEFSEKVQPKPRWKPNGNNPLWKLYGSSEEEWVCFSCD